MATLTAKEIQVWADEWAEYQNAIARIEATITDRTGPLKATAAEIEAKIKKWLKINGKPQRIEGELAIAEFAITDKFGDRVIDVDEFMRAAAGRSSDEIRECLTVEVKKAEKLLGADKVNEISSRSTVTKKTATLELK